MVMEAAPTAALIMPQPKFLLQFLIIAFDPPSELGEFDQALKADVLRQGREPVFGGLLLPLRPLDHKPFWQARFAQPIIAMGGSHPDSCKARGQPVERAFSPRDLGPDLLR